ncbi:hypothetical protein [Microbacterium sp. AK031]|uniref:hypothetical protein n=1 Tax=Microbacterium sp. AK031 TaxID=2723076 RepID=UPI00216A91D8|nr:hypothetical protein [Microbacterium sp. AK031]MCS3843027.1 hypothetical protein [Microbacterium sp. AK031]
MSRAPRRGRSLEPDGSVLRWPGARARFALFGEALWTGILMAITCVPIVTWPAAVAAGTAHLRRYIHAEATPASEFFRDVWRALPGGALLGGVTVALGALAGVNLALAAGGMIPGGVPAAIVAVIIGGGAFVITVVAAGVWSPGVRWRHLLRAAPRLVVADFSSAAFTVVALILAGVITWQFLPLGVPALGLVAFALVAIAERRLVRLADPLR